MAVNHAKDDGHHDRAPLFDRDIRTLLTGNLLGLRGEILVHYGPAAAAQARPLLKHARSDG